MRTHKEQNGAHQGPYVTKDLSRSVSPYLPDPTRIRDWTKEGPKIYWKSSTGYVFLPGILQILWDRSRYLSNDDHV